MTLQQIFDQIPMGLGGYALGLVELRSPELAGKLAAASNRPIKAFRIDFETGDPLLIGASQLLEGDDGSAGDDRPGLAGSGEPLPGSPAVAG